MCCPHRICSSSDFAPMTSCNFMLPAQVPYCAAEASLPQKLPTCAEVKSSKKILSDQYGTRVVAIGEHYAVKHGANVDFMEGHNMMYVRQVTCVSVPRVYAMFSDPHTAENYIVMQRVHGQRLDREWLGLNQHDKALIACKLKSIFNTLRTLPSPAAFCSLGRRPLLDYIFDADDQRDSLVGPFESEERLYEAMLGAIELSENWQGANLTHRINFYRRALSKVFCNHQPTFTHCDLQPRNIVIQRREGAPDAKNGSLTDYVVVVMGWRFAGWYPSFWEYAMSLCRGATWQHDWETYVDTVLQAYPIEWGWMQMIYKDLWS